MLPNTCDLIIPVALMHYLLYLLEIRGDRRTRTVRKTIGPVNQMERSPVTQMLANLKLSQEEGVARQLELLQARLCSR